MKNFTVKQNKLLEKDVQGFYNTEYVGYQQEGNPDFINHLKNMTKQKDELELVEDFIEVAERFENDVQEIIKKENLNHPTIVVVPRSKTEKSYKPCQLMFRKAISSIADKLGFDNQTSAIKRIKNTKTTHNWRMENNTGDMPYPGITKNTCEICNSNIANKDIILVDDIYTEGVNTIEDCLQTLLELGAKSVILYVIAKTRR